MVNRYDQIMGQLADLWKAQQMQEKVDPLESLLAPKTLQATDDDEEDDDAPVPPKRIQMSPDQLKDALSKAGYALGAIIFGGALVGYFSVFVQYKNALARHEKLNALLNHPNARVAAGDQVQRVTETMKVIQEQEEAKKNQEAVQRLLAMQTDKKKVLQKKFEVPTLKNLPSKKDQSAFQYSLCESIDYQQESLLPKNNYYSLEQV